MKKGTIIGFAAMLLLFPMHLRSQENILDQLSKIAIIDQKVMMPMRDGVRLASDIYRPKTDKPVPVIFSKTPYNFNTWGDGKFRPNSMYRALRAVEQGYAYVVQNERGRYFSEGAWDILGPPTTDGYDAFTWLADQPWCNGKIATYGCSSTAEWQMAVAALDHPAHAAMVPQGFGAGVGRIGDYFEQGNWYRGGAHQMLFTVWMYGTQHDVLRPRLPDGISQEDLLRLQRFYDMSPEMPPVDWTEALWHLPIKDMMKSVRAEILHHIFHINLDNFNRQALEQRREKELDEVRMLSGQAASEGDNKEQQKPIKHEGNRVGRNDPCECGSGKKYKKCCGN